MRWCTCAGQPGRQVDGLSLHSALLFPHNVLAQETAQTLELNDNNNTFFPRFRLTQTCSVLFGSIDWHETMKGSNPLVRQGRTVYTGTSRTDGKGSKCCFKVILGLILVGLPSVLFYVERYQRQLELAFEELESQIVEVDADEMTTFPQKVRCGCGEVVVKCCGGVV